MKRETWFLVAVAGVAAWWWWRKGRQAPAPVLLAPGSARPTLLPMPAPGGGWNALVASAGTLPTCPPGQQYVIDSSGARRLCVPASTIRFVPPGAAAFGERVPSGDLGCLCKDGISRNFGCCN